MYDSLVKLIQSARVPFGVPGSGSTNELILDAESNLGFRLPDSYKWWLKTYGGGQIRDDILYGVEGEGAPNLIELHGQNVREGYFDPKYLFFCIGNAEQFCFDTSDLRQNEYPVFEYDFSTNELLPYAQDFANFLEKRITFMYRIPESPDALSRYWKRRAQDFTK